jgi:ribose transport system substrate-binding protein
MKYASVIAAVGLMLTGAAEAADKKVIVWVPNGASDFWKLAEAGMHKAQKELPNFDLQWKYPERADAAIQQRLMEDLVAAGAAAVAVSPLNPKTQVEAFNKIGSQVPLFTFDSDAADAAPYIGSPTPTLAKMQARSPSKPCRTAPSAWAVGMQADNARERIEGFGCRQCEEHPAGRRPD